MQAVSQYEVRCPRCDVTFPPETKVCMHCGARTGPSVVEIPYQQPALGDEAAPIVQMRAGEGKVGGSPFAPDFDIDEDEGGGGRSTLLRSASTLIWIALAILFTVMRACSEN